MSRKIRIEYQRTGCIGAFACVSMDPDRWIMANDSKADLIQGTPFEKDGDPWFWLELTIHDDKELEKIKNGAEVCPVAVIQVYDAHTKEKLV